jgi:hypothetical protein
MTEPLARRGVYKQIVVGIALLALGPVALLAQQPRYVIFPLVFTGIIVTAVVASVMPSTLRAYHDAEARKIVARDL